MTRRSRLTFPGQDILAAHRAIDNQRVMNIVSHMEAAFKESQAELLRVNGVLNTFKHMLAAVVKRYGPMEVTEDDVRTAGTTYALDCAAKDGGGFVLTVIDLPVMDSEPAPEPEAAVAESVAQP